MVDETGEKCNIGENDTNVWFLAGSGEVKFPVLVLYQPRKPFCFQLLSSVHLMGAAVDDEEVSTESIDHFNPSSSMQPNGVKFAYGQAIEQEVLRFYNLFDPEDNVLQFIYPYFEDNPFFPTGIGGDRALGEIGKQKFGIVPPSNYNDTNVLNEIISDDDVDGDSITDDGICILIICSADTGDNHGGYIGFRNPDGSFMDDGAMNVVIAQWKK